MINTITNNVKLSPQACQLRRLRISSGKSIKEIAEAVGETEENILFYENDKKQPTETVLNAITSYLISSSNAH